MIKQVRNLRQKHASGPKNATQSVALYDHAERAERFVQTSQTNKQTVICRLCWSLLNGNSSWDIKQNIHSLATLQGGAWLGQLLSKLDHAMHAQPHNRAAYAAAIDLIKLDLLEAHPDPTAQAVRQVQSGSSLHDSELLI